MRSFLWHVCTCSFVVLICGKVALKKWLRRWLLPRLNPIRIDVRRISTMEIYLLTYEVFAKDRLSLLMRPDSL